jgi:hypothetical protein
MDEAILDPGPESAELGDLPIFKITLKNSNDLVIGLTA